MSSQPPVIPPIPPSNEPETYGYPLTPGSEAGRSGGSLYSQSPATQYDYPLTPPSGYDPRMLSQVDADPVSLSNDFTAADSMTLYGSAGVWLVNPLIASSEEHLQESWPEFLPPDTLINPCFPFLTSPLPATSYVDPDTETRLAELDANLGDLTGDQMQYMHPDMHHVHGISPPPSVPPLQHGSSALHPPLERNGYQEGMPSSAAVGGLQLGPPAQIFAPSPLRANPRPGLTRASFPTYLRRALLRSHMPGSVLFPQANGMSTPDTPASLASSASSFMSLSPNPGSSQEESPDDTNFRRAVVGSAANVNAAHIRRMRPAKFQCGQCGRTFTARHNLINHENAHNGIRPYPCKNQCGGWFTTWSTAARHAKTFLGTRISRCYYASVCV